MGQRTGIEGQSDRAGARGQLTSRVFHGFPYGILMVDATGAVVAENDAATGLLGESEPGDGPRSCCALLGCRTSPPLEDACITELALESAGPLPELRVDREESPHGALWVTAAPLDVADARVLLHLRPGDPRDRRRRTSPHWTAAPQLRIRALGRTVVESAEGPIGGDWLHHRPGLLLKYLVAERGRMVHADEIVESFWPGADPGALNNVRHFVHALREKLEPGRAKGVPSSFVEAGRGGYMLSRERVWIDADDFEETVTAGLTAIERGEQEGAKRLLEEALELYRGDFLADEPYAEWAFTERERLRDLARESLSALAEMALAVNEVPEALAHYRRIAEMYPFDTKVQRQVIALYLRLGRRSDAVRRYHDLRVRMMREFGTGPEFELVELGGPDDAARPATSTG